MRRREFITLLGGAIVAWPFAARGQQLDRVRRIGVLETQAADDPEGKDRLAAFRQALEQLGWTDGHNVWIDTRWSAALPDNTRKYAVEFAGLAPDVVVAVGSATVGPLLQATRTVPIVFVAVPDPVGAGFVESLARPGGNATGFVMYEYSLSAKWVELLKEIAPGVRRAVVLRDAALTSGTGQFGAIQAVAPSVGLEVSPFNVGDTRAIERAVTTAAGSADSSLIVTGSALTVFHRNIIIELAARHKLPAIYPNRLFVTGGGLISYWGKYRRSLPTGRRLCRPNSQGREAGRSPCASADQIRAGRQLKTAKALGLSVPPSLLARADELIE
jgi:putative ABC transport system substrate-binding protein